MPPGQKSTLSTPLVAEGANRIGSFAAIKAAAAARLAATVVAPVTLGCVAYAATKFGHDSGCLRPSLNSIQLAYGIIAESLVRVKNCFRATFSPGTPSLRPRAMLIAGRSSGRPTSVFRTEEVTNSSSSFPTWRTTHRLIEPAASAAVSVTGNPAASTPPLL